jgi:hypothetical protein
MSWPQVLSSKGSKLEKALTYEGFTQTNRENSYENI